MSSQQPDRQKPTLTISRRTAFIIGGIVVLVVAVGLGAFFLGRSNSTTTSSTTTSSAPPATTTSRPPSTTTTSGSTTTTTSAAGQVLAPATVAPVAALCSEQLQFGADGTAGPTTCANGALNTLAWTYYAQNGIPSVLAAGPNATPQQVTNDLCSGLESSTIPIATDSYDLAQLYYGWQFATNLGNALVNNLCG